VVVAPSGEPFRTRDGHLVDVLRAPAIRVPGYRSLPRTQGQAPARACAEAYPWSATVATMLGVHAEVVRRADAMITATG